MGATRRPTVDAPAQVVLYFGGMPEPLAPADLLAARVGELEGFWLELVCAGCAAQVFYPFKLLARTHRAKRVDEVRSQFRCRHCGGRPGRVAVTNNAAGGPQYADRWTVTLVG
jgi:hypothetical protein